MVIRGVMCHLLMAKKLGGCSDSSSRAEEGGRRQYIKDSDAFSMRPDNKAFERTAISQNRQILILDPEYLTLSNNHKVYIILKYTMNRKTLFTENYFI